ncbi:BTB/POZ domain-containing protein At5g03250-like [Phragmites australis]|uniref:BTB/POZ domain-containing protein At5g03250-like n=1 Tax=Phragmites australis TaxID=29695 RepID=UPI002D78B79B|nr:BTB/POZ domain-containing protein At5g03250-like [Phragmites australis]
MATMKLGSKPEIFVLEDLTWRCMTELESDVVVEVGEMSFNLHKFPLLSRSGVLQRMISEYLPPADGGGMCTLQLDDIPGGAKAFELAAKFCYDVKIELNALNVVCLRCAAEYLHMTDDYAEGNLITQAESFLTDVLANWKDSIKALETCEGVLPTAEDLHLVSRCITALASKVCASDAAASLLRNASVDKDALWNGIGSGDTPRGLPVASSAAAAASGMDWWYEDVSFLSLPMFKRLIQAMEAKGMRAESIAGAIMFYAGRFLPGLKRNTSFSNALSGFGGDAGSRNITPRAANVSAPSEGDQRYFLEEIVALLPTKKGVASTKFLLGMLRTAMLLLASPLCRENLERRIGAQLEDASLDDLLVPNLGYHVETLYDIDCVQRILDYFMSSTDGLGTGYTSPAVAEEGGSGLGAPQAGTPSSSLSPITMVAKLMDGYLAEVAPDTNLKLPKFQALAAVVPDYARPVDDGIYRAIDIYLKSHPWLSESEREQLCRLMNCQKLSLEACTHAAQNERLPLRVVVQVLFFEQLRLRTSIAGWFFVSDNAAAEADGARPHPGGAIVPKGARAGALAEAEADTDAEAPEGKEETITDVKARVSELEKECKSMKQEIRRLGKPRRSWSLLTRKCGFGAKVQQAQPAMNGK